MARKQKKRGRAPRPPEKKIETGTGPVLSDKGSYYELSQVPGNLGLAVGSASLQAFRAEKQGSPPALPVIQQRSPGVTRALHTESTLTLTGPEADRLLREYNRALIDNGFALSRRELRKKDMLDMRGLLDIKDLEGWQTPNPGTTPEDQLYTVEDYWYAFVPCFTEGVMQVNRNRYIYWHIRELSIEQNRMNLYLHDYIFYENSGWQPGVSGTLVWRFKDPETERKTAIEERRRLAAEYAILDGEPNYTDVYTALDVTYLGWNRQDVQNWEDLVVSFARNTAKALNEQTGKTNLDNLAQLFASYTIRANHALQANKIAKSSAVKSEHEEYTKRAAEARARGEKPPKERRTRIIGGLTVTSSETPKPPRKSAVIRYQKAAWKQRGHIRRYKKTGKAIYVEECVHRRKCLQTPDGAQDIDQTPLTVKFKAPEQAPEKGNQNHE